MNDWDVNEYWYFFSDPTHGKARKIVDRLDLDWLDDIESLYYSTEVSFFTKEMIQELSGWTEDEVRMLFYDRRFPSADYGRNPVVEVHALIQFFAKKEMVMKRLQKWWDDHGETITYLRKLR